MGERFGGGGILNVNNGEDVSVASVIYAFFILFRLIWEREKRKGDD